LSLNKILARDLKFVRCFLDRMDSSERSEMPDMAGCYSVNSFPFCSCQASRFARNCLKIAVKKEEHLN